MAEASALAERCELSLPGIEDNIIVGFRRNGAGCVYVGADPVFQFNTQSELRRGFRHGNLLKAESGKLVELRRERTGVEVQLLRHVVDAEEQAQLLTTVEDCLRQIVEALRSGQARVVSQVPAEIDFPARITDWISRIPFPVRIAQQPNVAPP